MTQLVTVLVLALARGFAATHALKERIAFACTLALPVWRRRGSRDICGAV